MNALSVDGRWIHLLAENAEVMDIPITIAGMIPVVASVLRTTSRAMGAGVRGIGIFVISAMKRPSGSIEMIYYQRCGHKIGHGKAQYINQYCPECRDQRRRAMEYEDRRGE